MGASAAAAAARLLSWPSSCRRASPAEALPKKLSFDGAAGSAAAASLELPKKESLEGAASSAANVRRGTSGHHGLRTTVRGMLVCNSMAHAHLALRCFARRFGRAGSERERARGVRSKNRFARPSGGGWMDCLLNVAVALPGGRWFVCEVQVVHRQLLTVRAELGAHHGYNDYRAALEMLEASGCVELGSAESTTSA